MIVKGIQGQSFFDLVIQEYGHIDGIDDMIRRNPNLSLINYVTDQTVITGPPVRAQIAEILKVKRVVTE
jgi:hypothetical protein